MLERLTALSVVSAILQIVDFGCKIVSQTQEIYHSASGATKDNVTRTEIADDIKLLYKDLTRKDDTLQRSSKEDISLGRLVDACNQEARNLLQFWEELEVPENSTQWASFRKAIKVARKRGKVEGMETRLHKLQRQINSRLLLMIKYVLIFCNGRN